jgi:KDO2-lipid IV(A) lauroyltransferase
MSRGYPITPEQRAQMRSARARMTARARKKGWGKRLSYAVQAGLLFPLIGALKLMPLDIASAFGGWFGRQVAYRAINRPDHYRTMHVAFPGASEADLDAILLGMCENIGRVLGETVHLPDFAGAGNPRVRLKGLGYIEDLKRKGGPILFLGGHFGNWEVIQPALRAAGIDGLSVVQHPNNPHVLELIARLRYRAGLSGQVAAEEGVYAALRRQLKAGGAAAILADQRVLNGISATFFGLETMTNLIPARLARDLGVPVVLMSNRRLGGAHFEIEFHEPLTPAHTGDRAADERAFTTRINRFYEEQILRAPAYWLWGHPRFDDALGRLSPPQPGSGKTSANPLRGDDSGSRPD